MVPLARSWCSTGWACPGRPPETHHLHHELPHRLFLLFLLHCSPICQYYPLSFLTVILIDFSRLIPLLQLCSQRVGIGFFRHKFPLCGHCCRTRRGGQQGPAGAHAWGTCHSVHTGDINLVISPTIVLCQLANADSDTFNSRYNPLLRSSTISAAAETFQLTPHLWVSDLCKPDLKRCCAVPQPKKRCTLWDTLMRIL